MKRLQPRRPANIGSVRKKSKYYPYQVRIHPSSRMDSFYDISKFKSLDFANRTRGLEAN